LVFASVSIVWKMTDVRKLPTVTTDDEESDEEILEELGSTGLCVKYPKLINGSLILLFFIGGLGIFMSLEGAGPITAVYVMMQILTTIGYGDITPERDITRFLLAIYVLFTLVFAANLVNDIGNELVEKEQESLRDHLKGLAHHIWKGDAKVEHSPLQRLKLWRLLSSGIILAVFIGFGTLFYSTYEACSCSYGLTEAEDCTKDNCAKAGSEKSPAQALYMSIITLTTVGFGDFTPLSRVGRVLGVAWMFFGVLAFANMVSTLSTTFGAMKKVVKFNEEVSADVLMAVTASSDSHISKADFIQFMAVKHGLVDKTDLEEMKETYASCDADHNGQVSFTEIQEWFADDEKR